MTEAYGPCLQTPRGFTLTPHPLWAFRNRSPKNNLPAGDADLAETLAVRLESHAESYDINKEHLQSLFKKSMDNTLKRVRSLKKTP